MRPTAVPAVAYRADPNDTPSRCGGTGDFFVAQFPDWTDQYGAWLAPYTDHTLIHVPFIVSLAATIIAY